MRICYILFFFFQAEDGIRDKLVTGVQTCALPISPPPSACRRAGSPGHPAPGDPARRQADGGGDRPAVPLVLPRVALRRRGAGSGRARGETAGVGGEALGRGGAAARGGGRAPVPARAPLLGRAPHPARPPV